MAKRQVREVRDPVEVACEILRKQGSPMMARALLAEAIAGAGEDAHNINLLASLQTEISLDNRFVPGTHGTWGLHEWAPHPKPARGSSKTPAVGRQAKVDPVDEDEAEPVADSSDEWD